MPDCLKCEHSNKWTDIWPKLPQECKECNRGGYKENIHPPNMFSLIKNKNNYKEKV